MEHISEIVEDFGDLFEQVTKQDKCASPPTAAVVAALLLLARELRYYRQWAEEPHST